MTDFKYKLRAAQLSASAVPDSAPAPIEPDFRLLFCDARPLRNDNRYYAGLTQTTCQRSSSVCPSLPHVTVGPVAPTALFPDEPLQANNDASFIRSGLPVHTLRRLRRGYWRCVAELDLHGLNRYQAQRTLAAFLNHMTSRGQCVRIIHGKGTRSTGAPVLKYIVRAWLQQQLNVLAYCQANDKVGGSGALIVLLKSPSNKHS